MSFDIHATTKESEHGEARVFLSLLLMLQVSCKVRSIMRPKHNPTPVAQALFAQVGIHVRA